ncbi:MAG: HEAT repeat domain-containing protein [Planctomycetes bacterium]|nr:HEAT repeat domain-containing protein [Planctomycetota bacterium]
MKNAHLHFIWAIVALALAAVASLASRRTVPEAAPAPEGRASAALRARVAELEAELRRRESPGEGRTADRPVAAEKAPETTPDVPALSVDQIRALLKSSNREEQGRGLREFEALADPPQKLALLREMVNSGNFVTRAVSILKKMGGPEAVAMMVDVLAKEGPSGPRTKAALALGEMGDASAIPALQEAWRTGDLPLRTAAAVGLDRFGQRDPVQASLRTFAAMLEAPDGGTRVDAVDLMTEMLVPGSMPLLVKALADPSNSHLREDAADALGVHRMADSLPFLEKALQDPAANVREAAQRAINKIKTPAGTKN